ncbi:precorrin-2 C20-methyltransferase [Thalassoporum mexicanum PCC 7367]|uniref:precorrin-2 C(20)-methyltransferase n=1 Tax=Thalassoporum mexicanum TaxID=3457544 RepID=UPI00029FA46A|nr:precorrin-2 C(20)-methyltransferase [Pseudanabaena sp. PCC 7367]AFY71111.1 precorrin-2 C20-methyltransferase [Pseudanabaena sp. PCC 7367]
MTGKLYGVSVGPGDPELITLKGLKAIQSADVVAFPAGKNGKPGMAESIAQTYLQPHQEKLPLELPYVQDPDALTTAWAVATDQLYEHLSRDRRVVFISEGDVSFYSTFTYLMLTLRARDTAIEIQTIPGVCSPLAAAAELGLPLTIWAEKLAVLPLLHNLAELETALDWAETVVLMKVNRYYPQVWQILRSRQLLQNSSVVVRATSNQQKIYADLTNLADLSLSYFSVLIVRRSQQWFNSS